MRSLASVHKRKNLLLLQVMTHCSPDSSTRDIFFVSNSRESVYSLLNQLIPCFLFIIRLLIPASPSIRNLSFSFTKISSLTFTNREFLSNQPEYIII